MGAIIINGQSSMEWIKVQGNKFVKDSGQTIVFHGLDASDPDKLEKDGHWDTEYFAAIKSWGANMVRFPVHPEPGERGARKPTSSYWIKVFLGPQTMVFM